MKGGAGFGKYNVIHIPGYMLAVALSAQKTRGTISPFLPEKRGLNWAVLISLKGV